MNILKKFRKTNTTLHGKLGSPAQGRNGFGGDAKLRNFIMALSWREPEVSGRQAAEPY